MIGNSGRTNGLVRRSLDPRPLLLALAGLAAYPVPGYGQSAVPTDQFHVSVTVGRHFLIGVGYTHWVEEHHALEFTAFPFAHPKEGFPFGLRAGYGWVPSDEVWRAKLGANVTLLIHPGETGGSRFIPTLGLSPGIQYDPDPDRSFRADFWMSYYIKEGILTPTGLEFFYAWPW
jgi:hypothetical protein